MVVVAATAPLVGPSTAFANEGGGSKTTLSLDDILQMEGFGSAAVVQAGDCVVFERIRPYDAIGDYSLRTTAWQRLGHQIWRYNPDSDAEAELLPGLDPTPSSFLQGKSPTGRFLAIMQYHWGKLSLIAYDMTRETGVQFEQIPVISQTGTGGDAPVWISDDEMAFVAQPEGSAYTYSGVRVQTGEMLYRAWQDAWLGNESTAHETRTSTDEAAGQQEDSLLVRANAQTGASTVLAEGMYTDLRVSPDRKHLAALSVSRPQAAKVGQLVDSDPRHYRLGLFDLEAGTNRSLAPYLEFLPYTITWAPDGKRLAAFGWHADEAPRDGRFYVINVGSGEVIRYEHVGLDLASERERGWVQRPERAMFLEDDLVVFARRIPDDEDQTPRFSYRDVRPTGLPKTDWFALSSDGKSRILTEDIPDVSAVPIHAGDGDVTIWAKEGAFKIYADGERGRLTPRLVGRYQLIPVTTFTTPGNVARPEFADSALFEVRGERDTQIVLVDLRDGFEGDARSVTSPTPDATPLAGSLRAGEVLFRAEEGPTSKLLLSTAGSESGPRQIAQVNSHLAMRSTGKWKAVEYTVDDPQGALPPSTVKSCVLLPVDRDRSTSPPLIVEVYPGSEPRCDAPTIWGTRYLNSVSPYLWAARGYGYVRLALPSELIRTPEGPIAGMDELVDAGVETVAEKGLIDRSRVVLFGFSQGGVSALYTAAHFEHFNAVVAMNSWADLFSHYFGGAGVYAPVYDKFGAFTRYDAERGSDFGIGRTPFEDPEIFYRNSPVFLAPQIGTPVMLIHSDMDGFSMSQFDEMFGALKRAGKDARYVRYWGEGHGPSSPANIRDMWQRIDDFLGEHGVVP